MADVLVVDDSDSMREMISSRLSQIHTVHEAADGSEAFDIATQSGKHF